MTPVGYMIIGALSLFASVTLCALASLRRKNLEIFSGKSNLHPSLAGGVIVWAATLCGIAAAVVLMDLALSLSTILILLCATGCVVVGKYDDSYRLHWSAKLLALSALALPAAAGMDYVSFAHSFGLTTSGAAQFLFLFGWILCVTNAFNLIDGMDGLATVQIVVALVVLAMLSGAPAIVVVCITAISSSLAFLRHNLPNATMYLGDTGSLSLGFLIGCLGAQSIALQADFAGSTVVMLLLGLPLFEVLLSIVRRIAAGVNPFAPDTDHIHHRILALVDGNKNYALMLHSVFAICLASLAFSVHLAPALAPPTIITVCLIALCAVVGLGYTGRSDEWFASQLKEFYTPLKPWKTL